MRHKDGDNKYSIQTVSITIAGLVASALNGIIAYVAVYFFKPLWEKLMKAIGKSNE